MNATDFYAVTYGPEVRCVGCLPDGVDADSAAVTPIFADSEWDYYPTCDACHAEHDYVNLTSHGRAEIRRRNAAPGVACLLRDDGTLPQYTSVGCCTIMYVDRDGEVFCAKCAAKSLDDSDPRRRACDHGAFDEGPAETCCDCGDGIESSYGDPDAGKVRP